MYAVIANGGKQYKVAEGQILKLEQINKDSGETIEFNEILLVADGDNITLGAPFVQNALVKAEIVEHGRNKKINIIKFRRRKHSMKRQGHRQNFTAVKIVGIERAK